MIPLVDDARPQLARGPKSDNAGPSGHHSIALASITLIAFVAATTTIALWRAYDGTSPELDRAMAARQLQARAGQASQELIEKTKGIEATQQEWIEQLLVMQDQLQSMRRLSKQNPRGCPNRSRRLQRRSTAYGNLLQTRKRQTLATRRPKPVKTRRGGRGNVRAAQADEIARLGASWGRCTASLCHLLATVKNGIVASKPQEFRSSRLQSYWSLAMSRVGAEC